MPTWILLAQWIARAILTILFLLSIWSVGIMIDRYKIFKALKGSRALEKGALKAAAKAGKDPEQIDRAVRSYVIEERTRLEKGLTVLATLGSNAPFIGLFGTVLGIIEAFGELSNSGKGAEAVMSGISEALVATAVGLFVAIPAVIAYNYFNRELKVLVSQCEIARDRYVVENGG